MGHDCVDLLPDFQPVLGDAFRIGRVVAVTGKLDGAGGTHRDTGAAADAFFRDDMIAVITLFDGVYLAPFFLADSAANTFIRIHPCIVIGVDDLGGIDAKFVD